MLTISSGRKRMIALALLIAAVVVALLIVGLRRRYLRYENAYAELQPRTSEREVIRRFGEPAERRRCRPKPSWDGEPIKEDFGNCVEEFWSYSKISPEQWVVGFDANGLALTKYHFASP